MKRRKIRNSMRSSTYKYKKRIFSGLSCGEEDIEDITVVDEGFKLNHNILKEDELDMMCYDDNFLYCYSDAQLPKVLSDIFNLNTYEPSVETKKENINENTTFKRFLLNEDCNLIIEFGLPTRFVKIKNPKRMMFSVYPIKRKANLIYDGEESAEQQEIDLLPLVENYPKYLSFKDLVKRVRNVIQGEWDKLHKDKKPVYIQ